MCMNEVCFVCLFHMLMRKQMILTILIIAVALGAVPEYQIVTVLLRPATDCASVNAGPFLALLHAPVIYLSSVYLLRGVPTHGFHTEEENQEVAKGHQSHDCISRMGDDACLIQSQKRLNRKIRCCKSRHDSYAKVHRIDDTKPFRLNRNDKKQQEALVQASLDTAWVLEQARRFCKRG